jgi:hypothetical protein
MDGDRNIYVLDVERYKTKSISDHFDRIFGMYSKWQFRKLVAEATAAQETIIDELKESYIKPQGLGLSIQKEKPTSHDGRKEERIEALLDPVYTNMQVWHYRGGNCQVLEDELVLRFPPHDDVKDSFSNCVKYLTPPSSAAHFSHRNRDNVISHPRFGGVSSAY